MTYLEPFFGSGSIFFRKAPSTIETINDLDGDVYNLFLQIRDNGDRLAGLVENTPWSRREYEEAYRKTDSDIENARRFLIRFWFSMGSRNYCKTGWRNNIKNSKGSIGPYWELPQVIQEASFRLKPKAGNIVQIENRDAFTLIEKYNRKEVLMYLDPPYVLSSRKNRRIYKREMPDEDHIRLCRLINTSRAKIILSGYESELYEKHLKNFNKTGIKTKDEKGNTKLEVLWANYPVPGSLFDFSEMFSAYENAV
jgi:DNA adenine methylase